jgi:hypothetical protein
MEKNKTESATFLIDKRGETHTTMSDCYISTALFTIKSNNKDINGLTVIKRSKVMRLDDFRIGKESTSYRLDKPNSKPFSTVQKLIDNEIAAGKHKEGIEI